MSGPGLGAFCHVTIGVTRPDEALGFWQRNFGLEVRDRREGPDANLTRLWGLAPELITRQALVATMFGSGPVMSCRSPAGFRIEVQR